MKPSCQAAVETEKLALMKRELSDCPELKNAPAEVIESLHHLWQEVQVKAKGDAECVTDLDKRIQLTIFESIVTIFELSVIFWGSRGSSGNWFEPNIYEF